MATKNLSIKEMFEAGVHFGHKKGRTHPLARPFTYILKDGIYVIDLEKTRKMLTEALDYLKREVKDGKTILMVGTKKQAQASVKETAEKIGLPYVASKWTGGLLTNFETIKSNLAKLKSLREELKSEDKQWTKKERKLKEEELKKLETKFGGIESLDKLPDTVFIVDANYEHIAVSEARRLGIPVVAICDTNTNPALIDYVIPANDDAEKSIELVLGQIKEAISEGKKNVKNSKN